MVASRRKTRPPEAPRWITIRWSDAACANPNCRRLIPVGSRAVYVPRPWRIVRNGGPPLACGTYCTEPDCRPDLLSRWAFEHGLPAPPAAGRPLPGGLTAPSGPGVQEWALK